MKKLRLTEGRPLSGTVNEPVDEETSRVKWTSSERKFLQKVSRTNDRTLALVRALAVILILVSLFMALIRMLMEPGEQLSWMMIGTSSFMLIVGFFFLRFTQILRDCKSILTKSGVLPQNGPK